MEHESKAIVGLFKDARRKTDMGEICDMWKPRRVARVAGRLKASPRVKELHSAIGLRSHCSDGQSGWSTGRRDVSVRTPGVRRVVM
jgi:hypothetical protein